VHAHSPARERECGRHGVYAILPSPVLSAGDFPSKRAMRTRRQHARSGARPPDGGGRAPGCGPLGAQTRFPSGDRGGMKRFALLLDENP